eukprot:PhF_6_TR15686/c0_g1_i1/m.24397/K00472/P4HA; prolyl 4-hydroxylase
MTRIPWKIIIFSLSSFSIFVVLNLLSAHHDPLWYVGLGHAENNTISNSNGDTATVIEPIEGIHYHATYDVKKLKKIRTKGNTVPRPKCKPPNCYILSHIPTVHYHPKFLTDAECDFLIKTANVSLERSLIAVKNNGASKDDSAVNDVRTSTQTWLFADAHPIVKQLQERLFAILGKSYEAEALQILHYEVGQKYDTHHDYFDPAYYGVQATNRAVTNFYYLNTVEEGGETWFPRANIGPAPYNTSECEKGLFVKPRKGSLAMFFDMMPSGELDTFSLHGGCPVKKGVKWGGTQWLRVPT